MNSSNTNLVTLGSLLRREREEAGLSLEKMADLLKARKEYINYIENDEYQQLPAEVYVRGMLKSYARLLDLNEKKVFRLYEEQKGSLNEESWLKPKPTVKKKRRFANWVVTPELFLGGGVVIIVAAVILYFLNALGNVSKPPTLTIIEPPGNNITVSEEKVKVVGKADYSSNLEINNQKINFNEEGIFIKEVALMEGINEIKIKAENKFGKTAEEVITVSYIPADKEN